AALRLADLIAAGAETSEELAAEAGAVPDRVHRLLRSLAAYGLFTQTGPRRWGLTAAGQTLRSDVPGSLHGLAVMWNEEHYDAFPRPRRCRAVRKARLRPALRHRLVDLPVRASGLITEVQRGHGEHGQEGPRRGCCGGGPGRGAAPGRRRWRGGRPHRGLPGPLRATQRDDPRPSPR